MDHQEFINTPVNHSEANKPTGSAAHQLPNAPFMVTDLLTTQ